MSCPRLVFLTSLLLSLSAVSNAQAQPRTLLTRMSDWQYPDAKLEQSTMSDAPTIDAEGKRTVASSFCKTRMITADSFEKVVAFYKTRLAQPTGMPLGKDAIQSWPRGVARSVTFHSASEGRPVKIEVIAVITEKTSTTLVISRGRGEPNTHIAWSEYELLQQKE